MPEYNNLTDKTSQEKKIYFSYNIEIARIVGLFPAIVFNQFKHHILSNDFGKIEICRREVSRLFFNYFNNRKIYRAISVLVAHGYLEKEDGEIIRNPNNKIQQSRTVITLGKLDFNNSKKNLRYFRLIKGLENESIAIKILFCKREDLKYTYLSFKYFIPYRTIKRAMKIIRSKKRINESLPQSSSEAGVANPTGHAPAIKLFYLKEYRR